MKEGSPKSVEHKESYDAILDFESYQAQEAILDPNLPDWFKDKILASAIATIKQVGERKAVYNAQQREETSPRKPK